MGLYDREYYREERSGFSLGGDRSMVTNLILVNVAVYVLDLLFDGALRDHLELQADLFRHPWDAWQLLTAGFLHSRNMWHIVTNMIVLYFFGRDVEGIYGRMEFLRIYLAIVILSSLAWVLTQVAEGHASPLVVMYGASGAVTGVLKLFILHFPKRVILLFGAIPIPAWLLGVVYIGADFLGYVGPAKEADGPKVAYETHLAGAGLAAIYFYAHLNLGRWLPSRLLGSLRRPKLRVHSPRENVSESLDERVDAVLDKVAKQGIDSLSASERKLLEDASRRYQRRRS